MSDLTTANCHRLAFLLPNLLLPRSFTQESADQALRCFIQIGVKVTWQSTDCCVCSLKVQCLCKTLAIICWKGRLLKACLCQSPLPAGSGTASMLCRLWLHLAHSCPGSRYATPWLQSEAEPVLSNMLCKGFWVIGAIIGILQHDDGIPGLQFIVLTLHCHNLTLYGP